ncbi:MAG: hypothetical protein U0359_32065 [Byssovorax sp.]
MPRAPLPLLSALVAAAPLLAGCGSSSIPSPREALSAYAAAAARGDADALYDMMSDKSRRTLSRDEVRRMVAGEKAELGEQSKALTAPGVVIKSRAQVRYADGEDASLDLDDQGIFRIAGADALPAGAKTPEQALSELRRVLARRSYAGLMRVLSPATRSAIEGDLRSLVTGLEHPEGLEVTVVGDVATVQVPGGHEVKLKREAGVWHVEDFD